MNVLYVMLYPKRLENIPEKPLPIMMLAKTGCLSIKGFSSGVIYTDCAKMLTVKCIMHTTLHQQYYQCSTAVLTNYAAFYGGRHMMQLHCAQQHTVYMQRSTMLGFSSTPSKWFRMNAATSGMLGLPGSMSLLSGSTEGPVWEHICRGKNSN